MKVSVIGASGYTGGELLRILASHPECEIICATSRTFEGKEVCTVHPNLKNILDLKFEAPNSRRITESDFVFVATPHGTSMNIVPEFVELGIKTVDLSSDFRFREIRIYERYYNTRHEHPEIKAVYGLPELHRNEIKKTKLVANPGCYPTAAVLALAPIIKESWMDAEKIVVDAKSGVSGAGAEPTHRTQYAMASDNISPYNVISHRHLPEIEQELQLLNKKTKISFVPHLVPVIRGISTTIHCFLRESVNSKEIQKLYSKFYKDEPFVRVLNAGEIPRLSAVRGSNYIDVGCFEVDEERKRLILVSAIDNLVKGAAGQAVQNMNIMAGHEETMGLKQAGIHP